MIPLSARIPLDRPFATINSPRRLSRKGANMSLVTAFCLSNQDVLFAADRVHVTTDEKENVVDRTVTDEKLVHYGNGVIGYAGDPGLARDIIKSLPENIDDPHRLGELFGDIRHNLVRRLPQSLADSRKVEFLYSNGPDCLYTFKSDHGFTAENETQGFAAIGITQYARFVYAMFNGAMALQIEAAQRLAALQTVITHNALTLHLEDTAMVLEAEKGGAPPEAITERAKRLAALINSITAGVNPTCVSEEMDMWLLRYGSGKPERLADVDAVRESIRKYRRGALAALYRLPTPEPAESPPTPRTKRTPKPRTRKRSPET